MEKRRAAQDPPMSKPPRQSSPSEVEPSPEPTFEKALAELEKIVAQMEGGNLSLEQALAAHQRGLKLARLCQDRLEAAQQQVKVLEGDVLKPLAPAEPGADD